MASDFDLVLFGASGFTGRLVAEYLREHAPAQLRWAIAGRSQLKLDALGLGVPVLIADALDEPAVRAIAARTRVICTTAGPFARYGSAIVAACAAAGTHYCDLTGEVPWMRRMIDAHHARAVETGARIVHTCGFDSIPSDLGTWATQQAFVAKFGRPAQKVTALFGETSGGFSGGTVASALDTMREADEPGVRTLIENPYALDPDPAAARPDAPDERSITMEPHLKLFTAPFVMAQVNSRVVRRGHALAGLPWGDGFVYREAMSAPADLRGFAMAAGIFGGSAALGFALKTKGLRDLVAKRAPRPGDGPSPAARARGHWKLRLIAEAKPAAGAVERAEQVLIYTVSDRADPGYGSTAKMLGESALCLALDPLTSQGGVLTPSVAMGQHLLDRLRSVGLTFEVASRAKN